MKSLCLRFLVLLSFGLSQCRTTGEAPVYRVKVAPGDTLSSIAAKFGTSWQAILNLNRISDYRTIRVGQVLLVKPGPGGYLPIPKTSEPLNSRSPKAKRRSLFFSGGHNQSQIAPRNSQLEPSKKENGLLFGLGSSSNFKWPVRGAISSYFGPRWGRFHYGIDIKAKKGTAIRASQSGKITFSGWMKGYGRTVIVEHEDGISTLYGHCSKLRRRKGQRVSRGDVIGDVGRSGNARGVHLHFEYRDPEGSPIDPLKILSSSPKLSMAAPRFSIW